MTTEKFKLIDKANILHAACILFGHNEIGKEKFVEIVARTADEISDPICGEQPQVADASKMEQPKVDLEKAIEDYYGNIPDDEDKVKAARHFYKLGLNARKEK